MNDLGKQICRCIVGACDDTCKYYDAEKACCVGYGEVAEQAEKAFAEYEDYKNLEEQGKLMKLPCKVGDLTYNASMLFRKVVDAVVKRIEIDADGLWVITSSGTHSFDDFGKTVFFTCEEAEEALKRMEDGK